MFFIRFKKAECDVEAEIYNSNSQLTKFSNALTAYHLLKYRELVKGVHIYDNKRGIDYGCSGIGKITFIDRGDFQATLWKGREIGIYHKDKRRIATAKIIKIFNDDMDRDNIFKSNNPESILTDAHSLNVGLAAHMEWGEDARQPLDNKIMHHLPSLSGQEIDLLCKYLIGVFNDVIWKLYHNNYDYKDNKFNIDVKSEVMKKYPWIDGSNLKHLDTQGNYYSWHG